MQYSSRGLAEPATPARSDAELDAWLEVIGPGACPGPAVDERALQAAARFARSLRQLMRDVAVEVVLDKLEEVPAAE
jgi:hypothetical protein